MANIFQRIFYKDYQCQLFDMIKENDVHQRHDEWLNMDGARNIKHSEEMYSIRGKKFFVCATCTRDKDVTYRLYMEDNRPASALPYQATQINTKFAEQIYRKMLNKYQDTHYVR